MKVKIDNTVVAPSTLVFEHTKVIFTDDGGHEGYLIMPTELVNAAGLEYIRDHAILEYSSFLEEYIVRVSFNDYHNDLERNPVKTIEVKFVDIQPGTYREIYKDATGKYYLREDFYPRENFAKWYICGNRIPGDDDGYEARPNLIFCCDGQQERVRFDDWNGVAAYSDTYNRSFRSA